MVILYGGLPDPSGGSFDAFDRFIDNSFLGYDEQLDLPAKRSADPYDETKMAADVMAALLSDISYVIPLAKGMGEVAGPSSSPRDGRDVRGATWYHWSGSETDFAASARPHSADPCAAPATLWAWYDALNTELRALHECLDGIYWRNT